MIMTKYYNVTVNGTVYEVEVEEIVNGAAANTVAQTPAAVPASKEAAPKPATPKPAPKAPAATASAGAGTPVNAPMQGTILKVAVSNGAAVKKGDLICLLEAMKMENEIMSPIDGTVGSVNVSKGAAVE